MRIASVGYSAGAGVNLCPPPLSMQPHLPPKRGTWLAPSKTQANEKLLVQSLGIEALFEMADADTLGALLHGMAPALAAFPHTVLAQVAQTLPTQLSSVEFMQWQ